MRTERCLQPINMKHLPQALVLSGYGLNCEEELAFGFTMGGVPADIVHVNDLIARKRILAKYQILAIPGGFSYGDDTGSGNAFAHKLKNYLYEDLIRFMKLDRLIIGICNGFQILVQLGLFPGVALLRNENVRYTVRWTDLRVSNNSPWLLHVSTLSLPIAHGEGKLYTKPAILRELVRKEQIALKYYNGEASKYQHLPSNPTGTMGNIAGITDESGRILGLMPHPERAIFFTQRPDWPLRREQYIRAHMPVPTFGPGMDIFRNAAFYFVT